MKLGTYLTNRKILLSLAVFAGAVFLFTIGFWIESKIVDGAEQRARMYQTAIQTQGDDQLNYSIDTQQGKVLTTVTIKAVDTVKFPEMNKEFPYVRKIEERYTQHERTVCETHYRTETRTRTVYDADGNASTETYTEEVPYEVCHQETYYTWDEINRWELEATKVNMAGREYPKAMFSLGTRDIDAKDIIDGATGQYIRKEADVWIDFNFFDSDDEGDIRTSYEVLELPKSGTVFLNTVGGVSAVSGGRISLSSESPQEQVKNAQKAAQTQSTIFKVFWYILIAVAVGFGVYGVWFYDSYTM